MDEWMLNFRRLSSNSICYLHHEFQNKKDKKIINQHLTKNTMKKKQTKILAVAITLFLALLFTNDSFAQSGGNDWILVKDSSNVKFYYKTVICNTSEIILYKITSSNPKPVNINWTVWGLGSKEVISIQPNEERTGSCTSNANLTSTIPAGAAITNNVLPIRFTVFN
jgi:hypothetical protein